MSLLGQFDQPADDFPAEKSSKNCNSAGLLTANLPLTGLLTADQKEISAEMPHNRPLIPSRRTNPLRELIAEKQRSAELRKSQRRVESFQQDLPSIISEQVDQHMDRLESKLAEEFKQLGKRAVEQGAQAITNQLSDRIATLEQLSAMQSRTIAGLKTSSKVAEQKVSQVVDSIESTLSQAVPGGFQLDPPRHAVHVQLEYDAQELVKADPRELQEIDGMPGETYVFCPNCTSKKVRRAYRHGIWEEFLRLFFIAPFRCRACRHKFYRF